MPVDDLAAFLMRFYRWLSAETARELVAELEDTKSLQSLAGHRVARAVQPLTAPDLRG